MEEQQKLSPTLFQEISLPLTLQDIEILLPYDSPELRKIVAELLPEAANLARIWGALAEYTPLPFNSEEVSLGGQLFKSALLRDQIGGLTRAFPFFASEGVELNLWSEKIAEKYKKASYAIRFLALKTAEDYLEKFLTSRLNLPSISAMAPGTLEEWPRSEIKPLFELMEPLISKTKVSISEIFWISPTVSSAGIYFESPTGFHNCRLCKDATCRWRSYPRME
ncbi:MAG: hypothetical protein LBF22_00840 [Deltaproteobacteria bacterium]|jgi:hypothetical protein|nr:hypothetical protein [Deltaproteobacteria bacterium]